MLGSSIAQQWRVARPDDELIGLTRQDVDLRDRDATAKAIVAAEPDLIIHAAAVVGGIGAKLAQPIKYLLDNVLLDSSLFAAALAAEVPKLLYIASAACYPENLRQPFVEEDILAAPLEPANEGYAISKIAGIKLCEYASQQFGYSYRVVVPSNLYGPNDDFSLSHGQLIPAAIAKVHRAHVDGEAEVTIWGDGTARREFAYSEDVAGWLVSEAPNLAKWPSLVNVGSGADHSIAEYYEAARDVVGYTGQFRFDVSKPIGIHQRLLDSSRARRLGWQPTTNLRDGMARVYETYKVKHSAEEDE